MFGTGILCKNAIQSLQKFIVFSLFVLLLSAPCPLHSHHPFSLQGLCHGAMKEMRE